jgi:hypothetical protein
VTAYEFNVGNSPFHNQSGGKVWEKPVRAFDDGPKDDARGDSIDGTND